MNSSPGYEVFDLDHVPYEEVRAGFTRTAIRSEDALSTVNWLEPGYVSTGQHTHPFDQISFVLSGTMRFQVGDDVIDVVSPGAVYIAGDVPHGGQPIGDERVLNIDVYAPPRADYLALCVNRDAFASDVGTATEARGEHDR